MQLQLGRLPTAGRLRSEPPIRPPEPPTVPQQKEMLRWLEYLCSTRRDFRNLSSSVAAFALAICEMPNTLQRGGWIGLRAFAALWPSPKCHLAFGLMLPTRSLLNAPRPTTLAMRPHARPLSVRSEIRKRAFTSAPASLEIESFRAGRPVAIQLSDFIWRYGAPDTIRTYDLCLQRAGRGPSKLSGP